MGFTDKQSIIRTRRQREIRKTQDLIARHQFPDAVTGDTAIRAIHSNFVFASGSTTSQAGASHKTRRYCAAKIRLQSLRCDWNQSTWNRFGFVEHTPMWAVVVMTIDDSGAYTKPWTTGFNLRWEEGPSCSSTCASRPTTHLNSWWVEESRSIEPVRLCRKRCGHPATAFASTPTAAAVPRAR